MMHRPHGDAERPAILTIWCGATNAWRSTAVIPVDGAPIRINGPTNSHGTTPVESVTALLTRLFSRLPDELCPMTAVSIEQVKVEALVPATSERVAEERAFLFERLLRAVPLHGLDRDLRDAIRVALRAASPADESAPRQEASAASASSGDGQ